MDWQLCAVGWGQLLLWEGKYFVIRRGHHLFFGKAVLVKCRDSLWSSTGSSVWSELRAGGGSGGCSLKEYSFYRINFPPRPHNSEPFLHHMGQRSQELCPLCCELSKNPSSPGFHVKRKLFGTRVASPWVFAEDLEKQLLNTAWHWKNLA